MLIHGPGAIHRRIDEAADIGFATGDAPLRQLQGADDDREHIVEIVRDAAGQLPDRLQLLHLTHLGFRLLAPAYFLQHPLMRGARFVARAAQFRHGVAHRGDKQRSSAEQQQTGHENDEAQAPVAAIARDKAIGQQRVFASLRAFDDGADFFHQFAAFVAYNGVQRRALRAALIQDNDALQLRQLLFAGGAQTRQLGAILRA